MEDASDPFIKKVVGCHNDGSVAIDRRVQTRGRFCLMIVKEKCRVSEYFQFSNYWVMLTCVLKTHVKEFKMSNFALKNMII